MLSAARSVLFAMLVTAGLVTLVLYTRRGETPDVTVKPDPERPAVSAADQKHVPVGSAGCLAAACHGAPAEKALRREYDDHTWQSSGACWTAADPHTAAYFVLTTTDTDTKNGVVKVSGEHIMRNLHSIRDPNVKPPAATEDVRCVACHTNPALAAEPNWKLPDKVALRSEGVSCEACHGAAGGWQGAHYTSEFKKDRKKGYTEHGMEPLYDMGERALACAGCHVGAPAQKDASGKEIVPVRDMNHDMIAAGHPRLNFDFADFQARLPRHWQEKERLKTGTPAYEPNPAKVWLVGRAAHAEAACKLLADRVERSKSDERTPWPEYAEFNCAACHHSLRSPTAQKETDAEKDSHSDWRQNLKHTAGRKPGAAPWQPIWPLTSASGLAWPARMHKGDVEEWERTNVLVPFAKRKHDESVARLAKVVWTIEDKWATLDAAPVATEAATKMAALRADWLALPDQVSQDRALKFVADAGAPIRDWETGAPKVREWDAAAQLFYGAAALERVKPVPANVANFRKVRDALRPQEDARAGPLRAFPLLNWNELQTGFKGILPK